MRFIGWKDAPASHLHPSCAEEVQLCLQQSPNKGRRPGFLLHTEAPSFGARGTTQLGPPRLLGPRGCGCSLRLQRRVCLAAGLVAANPHGCQERMRELSRQVRVSKRESCFPRGCSRELLKRTDRFPKLSLTDDGSPTARPTGLCDQAPRCPPILRYRRASGAPGETPLAPGTMSARRRPLERV